jgi:hypothetical protein
MQEFTPCSVCGRTPVIGERVSVMSNVRRESPVCDLCLGRPRARALGEVTRQERVRSSAGAANVRREWPVPAVTPIEPAAVG